MIFDGIDYPWEDRLTKAREYEENYIPYKEVEKPAFHLISRNGWMNDPNGFSEYDGQYHLFYQYYPYGAHWDSMHWGHAVSKDLVKWENLPCALAPDHSYDSFGVFSGCAVVRGDEHILMYTGVEELEKGMTEDGLWKQRQTQCIAIGDGLNYRKIAENPVIQPEEIPNCMVQDFRDPKVWKEGDTYYFITAARDRSYQGMLPVCSSKDLIHWNFCGTVYTNDPTVGTMCECPDFFRLPGENGNPVDIILTSVIKLHGNGLEIPAGPGVLYRQGDMASDKSAFDVKQLGMLDYGFDFYATHSLQAADGRCILTAWMSNLQSIIAPVPEKWCGMESFPRELFWKNNRIYSLPIREIENYYSNEVVYQDITLADGQITAFPGIKGRMLDMTVEIKDSDFTSLHMYLAQDEDFSTEISYDPEKHQLTYDRRNSGTEYPRIPYDEADHVRAISVTPVDGIVSIRILMDRFSTELFINDGEKTMTCLISTPQEADGIAFLSEGNAVISITKHDVIA